MVNTLSEQTINAKFWLHRGMVYLTELDYANALIHFNNALALDPDLTEAYIHRAIVYLALDRFTEADADVDYALQSSPIAYFCSSSKPVSDCSSPRNCSK
jgi:Tfp pilus assembly protein PilF